MIKIKSALGGNVYEINIDSMCTVKEDGKRFRVLIDGNMVGIYDSQEIAMNSLKIMATAIGVCEKNPEYKKLLVFEMPPESWDGVLIN